MAAKQPAPAKQLLAAAAALAGQLLPQRAPPTAAAVAAAAGCSCNFDGAAPQLPRARPARHGSSSRARAQRARSGRAEAGRRARARGSRVQAPGERRSRQGTGRGRAGVVRQLQDAGRVKTRAAQRRQRRQRRQRVTADSARSVRPRGRRNVAAEGGLERGAQRGSARSVTARRMVDVRVAVEHSAGRQLWRCQRHSGTHFLRHTHTHNTAGW
jgi:hypothetical protein